MDFNPNLLLHAAPAMVVLAISEFFLMNHEQRSKETKPNMLNSYLLAAGFLTVTATMKTVPFMLYTWLYEFRIFDLKLSSWWVILLCVVADDFTCYWSHRMTHSIRFFWASHLVHHSSETYNLTSGSRQSWVGVYTGSFMLWAWLPLIGFSPEMVLYVKSISTIYQFFLHTETIKKLPTWFEFFFNTPSHHRVHHSSDLENLDMNNGAMLIIWDRIFGTFRSEMSLTHHYGLCKKIEDPTPVSINFSEFSDIIRDVKKVNSLKHKFMYIFGAPGWSHDGSTKTAKQLRNEIVAQSNGYTNTAKQLNYELAAQTNGYTNTAKQLRNELVGQPNGYTNTAKQLRNDLPFQTNRSFGKQPQNVETNNVNTAATRHPAEYSRTVHARQHLHRA